MCTWENWVYSEPLCFTRIYGIQSYFLSRKGEKASPDPCCQENFSAERTSASQCLHFNVWKLSCDAPPTTFPTLLQAPEDWIKSCNHPSQESLRRQKIIIIFTIVFFFFSWSQLLESRLTTTSPMTDQNSSVQAQ